MKHNIEIPGLPEGWEPVAFRVPEYLEYYFSRYGFEQATDEWPDRPAAIIIQKTKPREITLVETDEERSVSYGDWYEDNDGKITQWTNKDFGSLCCFKIWRIKEE